MDTGQKYIYFYSIGIQYFQNINDRGKQLQPILGIIYKNENCFNKE